MRIVYNCLVFQEWNLTCLLFFPVTEIKYRCLTHQKYVTCRWFPKFLLDNQRHDFNSDFFLQSYLSEKKYHNFQNVKIILWHHFQVFLLNDLFLLLQTLSIHSVITLLTLTPSTTFQFILPSIYQHLCLHHP